MEFPGMKTLIIIFGLLYAVNCKPTASDLDDYLDDGQNDNDEYDGVTDDEESNAEANEEAEAYIITEEETFVRNLTETVLLPCVFSGDYVRLWKKSESILFQSPIRMGAANNMEELPDGTLKITNLTAKDDGQYECAMMVSEPNDKTKITHTLKIRMPPQIESLTAKDNRTVLKIGDALSLTCIARGYPTPTISWHKGGERLAIEGESLTILNVKHHDAGDYMCAADNKIGKPTTMIINIKVEFKPMVIIDQLSVSSSHNLSTELKCIVHAEPKATVVWTKDGVNVVNNQHTSLSSKKRTHILVIKNLQESDFGVYTCMASNYLGATSKSLTLSKTPALLGFKKPKMENRELVLAWEVQSKTPISAHELQYRKKGESHWNVVNPEPIRTENELHTVKYTLKGLDPGDYEARIRSQNQHGWSEYSEIKIFEGVHAKHGHHNKSHKKPHRDGKEKQTASTQEVVRSTEPPQITAEPAEQQEVVTTKNPQVGANESSGGAPLSSTVTMINVALVVLCLVRPPTIRI